MTEALSLFTQFGPGVAVMVLLVLLLYRLRDRVGSRVDESVESWIERLEKRLEKAEQELSDERETSVRYRAARERRDAVHRRWDSDLLRSALAGGDVSQVGDPPSLTPDPSEYELPARPGPREDRP